MEDDLLNFLNAQNERQVVVSNRFNQAMIRIDRYTGLDRDDEKDKKAYVREHASTHKHPYVVIEAGMRVLLVGLAAEN